MNRQELLDRKAQVEREIKHFQKELDDVNKELNKPVHLIIPMHIGNTDFVNSQEGLAYNVKVSKENERSFWLQTAEGTKGLDICMSRTEMEKIREAIDIVLGD